MRWNFDQSRFSDKTLKTKQSFLKGIDLFLLVLSLLGFVTVLFDVGFERDKLLNNELQLFYSICLLTFFVAYLIKLILQGFRNINRVRLFSEYILFLALLLMVLVRFTAAEQIALNYILLAILHERYFINLVFITIFFIQVSKYSLNIYQFNVNPALLFVGSFLILIFTGTGLLLLPQATEVDISIVDAFFTATSAVCVTGLIVVDTATRFTVFGKTIILILFQIGGLGFMTFSSFFGFFSKGSYSLQNQLFLKDFINEDRIGEISNTLFRIIIFTFSVELLGAVLIFFALDLNMIENFSDKARFAVFHAISAFCNAGFSTLSNGLYEEGIRDNYTVHLIIIFLIIVGGIGFPVIFNYYNYFKNVFAGTRRFLFERVAYQHTARVITTNTKIVVTTTLILISVGFIAFFIAEYNATLQGLPWYGKVTTALFGAVTPRTAGFNTVDMTAMTLPTVLIYLILMWIGASPGSTGGGLKTTTFAVAVLNALSIAKGKNRVEAFQREITAESIRKAFAVILLSFLVIGLAVFLVMFFDPEKELVSVAFECFSAFSTVGLSLGITGSLSTGSKIVICVTMFLGRVGILTLLVAFFQKVKNLNYRYPSESVFIS